MPLIPILRPMRRFAVLFTLVICAVTLTISGCGRTKPTQGEAAQKYSDKLREEVSDDVHDEQRKAQMLVLVDQLKALQLRFSEDTVSFIERYRKMNADYDATRPA